MKNMNTFLMEKITLRTSDGVGFEASIELLIQAKNSTTVESDETVQKMISENQNYLRIIYPFQHELRRLALQHPIKEMRPILDAKLTTLLEMFAEIFDVKIIRLTLESNFFRQMSEEHPIKCQMSPLFPSTFPMFSMISGFYH